MNKTTNELQSELDLLIEWFESDEFDIDTALDKYKKGQEIINELEKRLKETKNSINKLKVTLE